jgi:predicted Zn-dependent protease
MAIENPSYRDSHRPLMSGLSLLALFSVALIVLGVVGSFVLDREKRAEQAEPSSLSLMYLRLGLQYRPDDARLRLRVARAYLASGRLDETFDVLKPLLSSKSEHSLEANILNAELDFKTWAANEPDTIERSVAEQRLVNDIASLRDVTLAAVDAKHLADLARQTGQPAYAADILANQAWRDGSETEEYLAAADKAYLEAGQPMQAAKLHLMATERTAGPMRQQHALYALERARSADRPDETLAMLKTLVGRFPGDERLLRMAVVLAREAGDLNGAAGYGRALVELTPEQDAIISDQIAMELALGQVQNAFSLSLVLLGRHPADAQRHRQVAELALWNDQPLRALDEYAWLAYFTGNQGDRALALDLARANWDQSLMLDLTRQATHQGPWRAEELTELIKLYESIGDGGEALRVLQKELRGPLAQDRELWNRQLAIQLRLGQLPAAVDTLTSIAQRFGQTEIDAMLYADLLVRLGRAPEALTVLQNAPGDHRIERDRRVADLAWSLDFIQDAAAAYASIVIRPEATATEFVRLAHLQKKLGHSSNAVTTAMEAWRRFSDPSMLRFAMVAAFEAGDYDRLGPLIEVAKKAGPEFTASPDYWQLRVSFYQQLAQSAAAAGNYQRVRDLLDYAQQDLVAAVQSAPGHNLTYAGLWNNQHAQELTLALQTNDNASLKRLYDSGVISPTARENVYILHRLERDPQAIRVALQEIQNQDISAADREALTVDADALAKDIPRHAWVQTDLSTLQGLQSWRTGVGAIYSWKRGGLGASADYTNLETLKGAAFALERTNEISVKLTGNVLYAQFESVANVGINERIGETPRPFGAYEQRVRVLEEGVLNARAAINEVGTETAGLRALGVRDQAAIGAYLPIGKILLVNAIASGEQYLTRDRSFLGTGFTADAGTGVRFRVPPVADSGNVRLATHVAWRHPGDKPPAEVAINGAAPAGWLVPKSSVWVGVASTVVRGQLGTPRPAGGSISYLIDVYGGWLWPMNTVGYSARAGVGVKVFGRDEVSVSANASNMLSSAPGNMVWGINIQYAQSLWR